MPDNETLKKLKAAAEAVAKMQAAAKGVKSEIERLKTES